MSENFENDEKRSSWQSASSRRGGDNRRKFEDKGSSSRWSGDRSDRRRDGERSFGRDDRRGGFQGGRRDDRGDRRWSDDRSGRRRDGERSFGRDDRRGGFRDDRRDRRSHDRGRDGRPERLSDRDRNIERDRRDDREFNDPIVPAEITAEDLNRDTRRHLLSLNKDNADRVARFLVMAGSLMDSNPQLAYEHAKAAYRRAARIDIVREALGLTAYATEKYGEALRELRTYRRMSGDNAHIYLEADCERGMGRPERAIKYLEDADLSTLTPQTQIELALVVSGAYADLDESAKGLALIESLKVEDFGDDLRAPIELVRAERLRELGRDEEAEAIDEAWSAVWEAESIEVFDEDVTDDTFEEVSDEVERDDEDLDSGEEDVRFEDVTEVEDDSDDVLDDGEDIDPDLDDESDDEDYFDDVEVDDDIELDEEWEDDRFADLRDDDADRD